MPDFNIEEKIQEALKRKSFKDNKFEYLGLSLVFCLILFATFLAGYFLPFLSIFIFIFIDIPLIMGFKHFIWFGPASGETLIDGFKVSLICGYLNFVSYMKIFITTNLRAILWALASFTIVGSVGAFAIEKIYDSELNAFVSSIENTTTFEELYEIFIANETLLNACTALVIISAIIAFFTYYVLKLNRALLPYTSFLRLTNLEGKSMDGVIAHAKKMIHTKKWNYYFKSSLYHLLYLIPIVATILMYMLLNSNPVYSPTTIYLICSLTFFVTMFPAVLFIELNYRNFCIEVNQQYIKEHKKMLNDAINDLDKRI